MLYRLGAFHALLVQIIEFSLNYYNDTSTRFGTPLRKASIALKSSRQGDKETTTVICSGCKACSALCRAGKYKILSTQIAQLAPQIAPLATHIAPLAPQIAPLATRIAEAPSAWTQFAEARRQVDKGFGGLKIL